MSIIAINTKTTGLVGEQIEPRRCTMITTDNLATITTAGYLNNQNVNNGPILPTDVFEILYDFNTSTKQGTFGIFQVNYSNGNFTLNNWENPGNVLLPVTDGNVAIFNGTSGQIKNGLPPADINGDYIATTVAGVGNNGKLAYWADDQGLIAASDTVAENRVLYATINDPDPASNIIWIDESVGATELNSGPVVLYIPPDPGYGYRVRQIYASSNGVNFSGGGGDRLLAISDGTTVYSLIPAADLQTLTNNQWGSAKLPFPASAGIATVTQAGATIRAQYSGGTANYTTGGVVISICIERVV